MESVRPDEEYTFDASIYEKRVYQGFGKADKQAELKYGPNIKDWPKVYEMQDMKKHPVDVSIGRRPENEPSAARGSPLRSATGTAAAIGLPPAILHPEYVAKSKAVKAEDAARREGNPCEKIMSALAKVGDAKELVGKTSFGSCVFANKPGDGSAREQAASCQKVLGGDANICYEYATKRYRSNCINWGIVPFTIDAETKFEYQEGDFVFVPGLRKAIETGVEDIMGKVITANGVEDILLHCKGLTNNEKTILAEGCLMNFYAAQNRK